MEQQTDYNVSMEETHHTAKKDAPSGTAITLAEEIINLSSQKNKWILRQAIVEKGGNEHLAQKSVKSVLRAGGSILQRELIL